MPISDLAAKSDCANPQRTCGSYGSHGTCTVWNSCVDGAIRSGRRAADGILEKLP
ncbi:FAD-dependent oxidoreductase [Arthrobacter sp. CJ23]|uniref:FAD-dependent oxidoreductase n=1 Tax=Arthrobacter sp. CJ23 TaxID=2972479 RepID=UPI00215BFCCA|nr:FAD-dependent oxidoreductase [Arthrobacter sp. CJ23]UVJ41286.1 FAD-dependent oxidoreductase [Arthrobacter sp. CJ23]